MRNIEMHESRYDTSQRLTRYQIICERSAVLIIDRPPPPRRDMIRFSQTILLYYIYLEMFHYCLRDYTTNIQRSLTS